MRQLEPWELRSIMDQIISNQTAAVARLLRFDDLRLLRIYIQLWRARARARAMAYYTRARTLAQIQMGLWLIESDSDGPPPLVDSDAD